MKKIILFFLVSASTFAQQAVELDAKSVKLPRYDNIGAINAAIPTPVQGMMVYNKATGSNWVYNGTSWGNQSEVKVPLELSLNGTGFQSTFTSNATGVSGYAGYFNTSNPLNDKPTLNITNGGLGWGLYVQNNNLLNPNSAILANSNSAAATIFGTNNNTGSVAYFSASSTAPLSNPTLGVLNERNSNAASFLTNYPTSTSYAVSIGSNGQAASLFSQASGIGIAGYFSISNPASSATSIFSTTNGLGVAGKFTISNPSNSSSAIEAETNGSGFAGSFQGTNAIVADGLIKNKGFTQLGELSSEIKTVAFGAYIGAGSVQTITHNLNAGKILSITVFALLETGLPPYLRIPPSFLSLGNEYYYDYYFDDTKIYFIIPGTSTKVKNFFARVLITYTK